MNNTNSHHWTLDEETLEAFVLNRIGEQEMSVLTAHLEQCDECKQRVQHEREILTGIQRFGRMEMKRRLKLRLRRDQKRRFEWTQVASLAAAVVIMLTGVFVVRWFVNSQQPATKVQEIILSKNAEQNPAERSLWIIGKVIEVHDQPRSIAQFNKEKQSPILADKMAESQEEAKSDISAETKMMRSSPSAAFSKGNITDTARSLATQKPASLAKNEFEVQKTLSDQSTTQPKVTAKRDRKEIKEPFIVVRKGNMKELPASLKNGDASAIHTRLERTSQGIQLTFYSNSIRDTIAAHVEAVTQDSIIVTFSNRQISYHIPGGWAGKM